MSSYILLTWYAWAYPYIKVLHVSFIIFLMAGLLYLPRLFVYHRQVELGSQAFDLFHQMERRLMRVIIEPAWVVVILTGLFLAFNTVAFMMRAGSEALRPSMWFFVKIACVFALVIYYGLCVKWMKDIKRGTCSRSQTFFRLINEIPAILAFIIVFMVIVKP